MLNSWATAGRFRLGSAKWPLGQDCVLCGGRSDASLVGPCCEGLLTAVGAACMRCGIPLPAVGTCGNCVDHPPAFDAVVSAFAYRFPVDRLVQRFKHRGDLAIGRWLAGRIVARVRREPRPDLLVAPPLHPARLRERGFNQSQVLAGHVGATLGVAVACDGLRRLRATPPQAGLDRAARRRNLREAFACDLDLADRTVAIVDDVVTTGATAESLALALRLAGARRIAVWAVARTPDPVPDG